MIVGIYGGDGHQWRVISVSDDGYVTLERRDELAKKLLRSGVMSKVFERWTGLKVENVRAALLGSI